MGNLNKKLKIENVRLNVMLSIFSNMKNQEFKNNLNLNDNRFTEEESYILRQIVQNPLLLDEYGNSGSREEIMSKMEDTLDKKNSENNVEVDFIEDWGIEDLADIGQELNLLSDLDDELTDDILSDLENMQDILIEDDTSSNNIPKINVKKMDVVLNEIHFPIYLVENDKDILSIFNKEPHKLAFLWTYPELEPVLNIPALLRLMEKHSIQDEEVDVNYKDPNQIEYRLIKGMLALNVKGG